MLFGMFKEKEVIDNSNFDTSISNDIVEDYGTSIKDNNSNKDLIPLTSFGNSYNEDINLQESDLSSSKNIVNTQNQDLSNKPVSNVSVPNNISYQAPKVNNPNPTNNFQTVTNIPNQLNINQTYTNNASSNYQNNRNVQQASITPSNPSPSNFQNLNVQNIEQPAAINNGINALQDEENKDDDIKILMEPPSKKGISKLTSTLLGGNTPQIPNPVNNIPIKESSIPPVINTPKEIKPEPVQVSSPKKSDYPNYNAPMPNTNMAPPPNPRIVYQNPQTMVPNESLPRTNIPNVQNGMYYNNVNPTFYNNIPMNQTISPKQTLDKDSNKYTKLIINSHVNDEDQELDNVINPTNSYLVSSMDSELKLPDENVVSSIQNIIPKEETVPLEEHNVNMVLPIDKQETQNMIENVIPNDRVYESKNVKQPLNDPNNINNAEYQTPTFDVPITAPIINTGINPEERFNIPVVNDNINKLDEKQDTYGSAQIKKEDIYQLNTPLNKMLVEPVKEEVKSTNIVEPPVKLPEINVVPTPLPEVYMEPIKEEIPQTYEEEKEETYKPTIDEASIASRLVSASSPVELDKTEEENKFVINENVDVEPGFKICPKCGQKIRNDYKLCFVCGTYF